MGRFAGLVKLVKANLHPPYPSQPPSPPRPETVRAGPICDTMQTSDEF
jgi:hypothetical protein